MTRGRFSPGVFFLFRGFKSATTIYGIVSEVALPCNYWSAAKLLGEKPDFAEIAPVVAEKSSSSDAVCGFGPGVLVSPGLLKLSVSQ